MNALVVERADGATLQDGGRIGAGRWGVSRSGPMDALAHRLAARLAGHPSDDVDRVAALEATPRGCEVRAAGNVTVALAGAHAVLRVGDDPTGHRAPCVVALEDGEVATVATRTWAYVVPTGTIDVEPVLGARATHARSGLGPTVAAGTRLPVGPARRVVVGERDAPVPTREPLWLLPGPQQHLFSPAVLARLVEGPFSTTTTFDRMGHRLDGPSLPARAGHDVVSDGVVAGALQVPGDGRPFVLTADHQPTGGYPKPAVLTTASLARFVRLAPGSAVRFAWTTPADAVAELRAAHAAVERCVTGRVRAAGATLARHDLVGGVTDGS